MTTTGSPISSVQLRCGSCGAPYARLAPGEIQTCTYCGTSQRTVDAREFLEHFMAQVTAFVRQAVPAGLDVSRSKTVDPVARLSAFNSSIRPRLTTESDQYRFACFNLLSSPLAVLPFLQGSSAPGSADPTSISIFAAKVQSVSGLAVDDASRALIQRAGGLASCYQSLLVATHLADSSQPERYHLIGQNYATASDAIASTGLWPALAIRLSALSSHSRGVDVLLTGKELGESRRLLGIATEGLERSRSLLSAAPELGYMAAAVDQELAVVRTAGTMLDIVENSALVAPHPVVFIERLSGVLNWASKNAPGDWGASFRSMKTRTEVFRRAAHLRSAQAGRGTIKIAAVGSGTLVPFWAVELPYTFETGVLWTKHGKEVPEIVYWLQRLSPRISGILLVGAGRALTDIFSVSSGGGSLNAYYDRVRGKQTKITESGSLVPIVQNATVCSVHGSPAVPPFTTEQEGLQLVQRYVDGVKLSNARAAAQLRASSPRVLDLIYIPCSLNAHPPIPWLGALSPISLGDPQSLAGFVA